MPDPAKMVGLDVSETSGVDLPAHLLTGWVVLKSANSPVTPQTEETQVPEQDPKQDPASAATDDPTVAKAAGPMKCPKCQHEFMAKSAGDSIETLKAAMPEPLRKAFELMESTAQAAADREAAALKKAAQVEDTRLDEAAVAKAAEFTDLGLDAATFGPILRKFAGVSPEGAEGIERALRAALERGKADSLFGKAAGTVTDGKTTTAGGSAEEQLDALAKAAVTAGHAPNLAKALAMAGEAHPELYAQYRAELNQKG